MTNPYSLKEKLVRYHGEILMSGEVLPVRSHQAEEDYLQLERELGSMLRIQRDREGRYI